MRAIFDGSCDQDFADTALSLTAHCYITEILIAILKTFFPAIQRLILRISRDSFSISRA
jgi:hypothetical protein